MTDFQVGVMVEVENRYGHDYLVVRVMKREIENGKFLAEYPVNFSTGIFAWEGLAFADLELSGHFSSTDNKLVGFDVEYYQAFSVDQRRAEAMAKMLKKINNTIRKHEAREPGDVFMAFCKAIGAKFCATTKTKHYSSLRDAEWRFGPITDGRERLRSLIASEGRDAA